MLSVAITGLSDVASPLRPMTKSLPAARPWPGPDSESATTRTANRMAWITVTPPLRSEEHTSELQSQSNLVCRLLLEKKQKKHTTELVVLLQEALPVGRPEAGVARVDVGLELIDVRSIVRCGDRWPELLHNLPAVLLE